MTMPEAAGLVDIHNHLIPGVDDGARSVDEAVAALEAMRGQGVRRIVCTPHIDAELIARGEALAKRLRAVDTAWERLCEAAAERVPDIELHRGHEVMIDVPRFELDDARLRMAGGAYVLVEFPRHFVPAGLGDVLRAMREAGWLPIVAHPERYVATGFVGLDAVDRWRRAGAATIVNAGSLTGGFGHEARRVAVTLLRHGWADMIGSDYHARPHRPLLLAEAYRRIVGWGGAEQARLLLSTNPGRVIDGAPLEAVAPIDDAGRWWRTLRRRLRR